MYTYNIGEEVPVGSSGPLIHQREGSHGTETLDLSPGVGEGLNSQPGAD